MNNLMNLTHKKIGIWGFGIVGQSIVRWLIKQGYHSISIMDQRPIESTVKSITEHNIPVYTQDNASEFFEKHDLIIPSPGIDLRPYIHQLNKKLISELDLFSSFFSKKSIAITGTVGKTSVTTLLSSLLQRYNIPLVTGGNIGIGSCDLLDKQQSIEYVILETSDVQLKYSTMFAPDLALWTNFSANHLDWHGTLDDYFNAKLQILLHQKPHQHAVIPFEIIDQIRQVPALQKRTFHFFSCTPVAPHVIASSLKPHENLYFIEDEFIKKVTIGGRYTTLISSTLFPSITFASNWLIIVAALDQLGLSLPELSEKLHGLTVPEHRIEHVATINNIDFYNDSKGTTIIATQAAIDLLYDGKRPLVLFLGGLGKGVDRTPLIAHNSKKIDRLFCFGKEAEHLATIAHHYGINVQAHASLQDSFNACITSLKPHDIVLFSPAGTSWDLFENYQQRGLIFKQLVQLFKESMPELP